MQALLGPDLPGVLVALHQSYRLQDSGSSGKRQFPRVLPPLPCPQQSEMDRSCDSLSLFSSLVTYYVEGKGNERHHLAGEELGRLERAYASRGNIYSYILPWEPILRAAAKVTSVDVFKS